MDWELVLFGGAFLAGSTFFFWGAWKGRDVPTGFWGLSPYTFSPRTLFFTTLLALVGLLMVLRGAGVVS
jgi:hypothetical protein